MSEATPRRCAGVLAAACTQGKRTKHGKPQSVVSDDQPEAREGQAGRLGVAERFVIPLKPGNAGGGKGPQFKTDASVLGLISPRLSVSMEPCDACSDDQLVFVILQNITSLFGSSSQ